MTKTDRWFTSRNETWFLISANTCPRYDLVSEYLPTIVVDDVGDFALDVGRWLPWGLFWGRDGPFCAFDYVVVFWPGVRGGGAGLVCRRRCFRGWGFPVVENTLDVKKIMANCGQDPHGNTWYSCFGLLMMYWAPNDLLIQYMKTCILTYYKYKRLPKSNTRAGQEQGCWSRGMYFGSAQIVTEGQRES